MYSMFLIDPYHRGDHLRVVRASSAWVHEGIYLGGGYVIHVEYGGFVEIVTLAEFAQGGVPEVANGAQGREDAEMRVARAMQRLGQPYHPVSFNCQHLCNEANTGRAYSQTVTGVVVLGFVGGIMALAGRKR
jgi:hypothetical protein